MGSQALSTKVSSRVSIGDPGMTRAGTNGCAFRPLLDPTRRAGRKLSLVGFEMGTIKGVPDPGSQHSLGDAFSRIQQRAAEAAARKEKRGEAPPTQRLFLPGLAEFMRAVPNHVARSSLFAPIARGRRKFHHETLLVTRADAVMRYTGEQLDEADADLTLQLIYEAIQFPLGVAVTLNRARLLRAMGRSTGRNDYEWLQRRMKALTVATLFIEARRPDGSVKFRVGHLEAFHIVQSFRYDDASETYCFMMDPRWVQLFSNREFALIDWAKRLEIRRGQDMAKAFQRLIATSSNPVQRYALDWLKDKMQYAGRMRDFREALDRAMRELQRLELIASWGIERSTKGKEQLVMWSGTSG
ncbi:plasmid replication initiator TrfA [Thiobacillus sp.]|uniref:plasmid replication initiator TrfA n=1 Tax=Thiobacillus sp. TaxID=924 RepID=UPI0025DB5220|nr:plasmid replication initiator TrfA [Thiobacillus sp.]